MPWWGQGYSWTGDSASRGCKDIGHGRRGWSQALAWTVGQLGTLNPGWSQSQALAWKCESEKRILCPGSGRHARLWAEKGTEPWGRGISARPWRVDYRPAGGAVSRVGGSGQAPSWQEVLSPGWGQSQALAWRLWPAQNVEPEVASI